MTEIKIFKNASGSIVKAELNGHTGFGVAGEDIVCASVSSAFFMTVCGMDDVLGLSFDYETDDGYAVFVLPDDLNDEKRKCADVLLRSMNLFLEELSRQYPQNVRLTELEV